MSITQGYIFVLIIILGCPNLHLNALTNFDPIMSKMIGNVWEEMTVLPPGIARMRIPRGNDLMPNSSTAVRLEGQIMTHYAVLWTHTYNTYEKND